MSAVDSISSSAPPSSTSAFSTLASEDFIRVMFTELTNQDPSAPNDSQALLEQISSIRSIESDLSLTERLEEIALQSEIASSGSLLGKFVTGLNDSGAEVLGYVDSISITREGTVLNLSTGQSVAMRRVQEVIDPALIAPAGGESGGEGEGEDQAGPDASTG